MLLQQLPCLFPVLVKYHRVLRLVEGIHALGSVGLTYWIRFMLLYELDTLSAEYV